MRVAVAVLVLGDFARSPRMVYHVRSLIANGFDVDVVAYAGSELPVDLTHHQSRIKWHLKPPPTRLDAGSSSRLAFLLYAIGKVVTQIFTLLWTFLYCMQHSDYILVQNPPAIPTLFVVKLVCWISGSRAIIDWHNLGYSILAMNKKSSSTYVVNFAKYIETTFGRVAYAHLCVSHAMKDFLLHTVNVQGKLGVLHDMPPVYFKRLSVDEIHSFLMTVRKDPQMSWTAGNTASKTLLTKSTTKKITLNNQRPAIVVTSTSWTEDEDINLLLDAAVLLDSKISIKIIIVITGKGPMKTYYMQKIEKLTLANIQFKTVWLSVEDYPRLLGLADIGVSLHTSSSKLDLPMKVVDMFGCGLPVCSVNYECIGELVTQDTGMLFDTAAELADQIEELLSGFPSQCNQLDEFRRNITQRYANARWDVNWDETVLPLFV